MGLFRRDRGEEVSFDQYMDEHGEVDLNSLPLDVLYQILPDGTYFSPAASAALAAGVVGAHSLMPGAAPAGASEASAAYPAGIDWQAEGYGQGGWIGGNAYDPEHYAQRPVGASGAEQGEQPAIPYIVVEIQPGDTLSGLANAFAPHAGVDPQQMFDGILWSTGSAELAANPDLIMPGQRVVVPFVDDRVAQEVFWGGSQGAEPQSQGTVSPEMQTIAYAAPAAPETVNHENTPPPIPPEWQGPIQHAAETSGLPVSIIAGQLWQEATFRTDLTSRAGAQGPAQFMPETWASYGVDVDGDGLSPFDLQDAVDAQGRYMRDLMGPAHALNQEMGNRFTEEEVIRVALMGYNYGGARIHAFVRQHGRVPMPADAGLPIQWNGRTYEFPAETANYAEVILAHARHYGYGQPAPAPAPPPEAAPPPETTTTTTAPPAETPTRRGRITGWITSRNARPAEEPAAPAEYEGQDAEAAQAGWLSERGGGQVYWGENTAEDEGWVPEAQYAEWTRVEEDTDGWIGEAPEEMPTTTTTAPPGSTTTTVPEGYAAEAAPNADVGWLGAVMPAETAEPAAPQLTPEQQAYYEMMATPEGRMEWEVMALRELVAEAAETRDIAALNHFVLHSPLFNLPEGYPGAEAGVRYLPPADLLGMRYEFSQGAIDSQRNATSRAISGVLVLSHLWDTNPIVRERYPNSALRIGDLSADAGHASHDGTQIDLSSSMNYDPANGITHADGPAFKISAAEGTISTQVTHPNHDAELDVAMLTELANLTIDGSPVFPTILYNLGATGVPVPPQVQEYSNHDNHVHVDTEEGIDPGLAAAIKEAGHEYGGRPEQSSESLYWEYLRIRNGFM